MNERKICRNFQRGSCQYGERCKFLHVTQQQSKPSAFGFGVLSGSQFNQQQPQQRQNPFGFGVQNSSYSKSTSDFGPKYQNQAKPFENKWTRFSPIAAGNSTSSRQTDNQPPQAVNHKCTEPELCKHEIAKDFEHERPLWKLTCYGHSKNGPCDIIGDISYEELRAAAYEDARRGMSLQEIVQKERNLLSSKLIQFENLLRNPYVISQKPSSSTASLFPGTNVNASSAVVWSNAPPPVSSFAQLGSSINSGFTRPPAPSNHAFRQPSPFQISNQTSGVFGSQLPLHSFGSAPSSNILNFNNSSTNVGSNILTFSPVALPHHPSSANNQLISILNGTEIAVNTVGQASVDALSVDNKKAGVPGEASIWLREWKRGEIPEEPPPDEFI
ncbi:zinc finger CCCH domain-containing protein 46 isoform X2 [Magnolia sinica]|uniref:zinc finger CCCH domain-containing protein 46 isoform X2 n=1 Tax=Magnolia sinica TaxID=86752 RepID=UPI002659293A|nr:zinc finger CCCH domain-containing protein 46 isoform X2 [Magnolia sinica]